MLVAIVFGSEGKKKDFLRIEVVETLNTIANVEMKLDCFEDTLS